MQSGGSGGLQSANIAAYGSRAVNGGRFDFDDGGTYCGGWEDGKAHGHGVCTGPKGQGEYSGSWHFGFEVSGVYTWPSGSTFEGQWQNGKRHGLGTEYRGRWTYRGEWTQGFKGRYGVRQATASNAKYEGTWANGLQDGYGSEAYADGGTYQGQWLRGLRHGYGVRTSAPFGMAAHFRPKAPTGSLASLKSESAAEPTSERDRRMDDVRGGFVLKAKSDEPSARRRSLVERSTNIKESILKGLKLRKQRSTGDLDKKGTNTSVRSTVSNSSWMSSDSAQSGITHGSHHTDSNASFVVEDEHMDTNVTETYMGEWKNDKRSGFGISERTDGLKYEGEWYNNKKYGYGVTTLKDGSKEEGKYKNNVLITSQKKKHLFLMRSAKFRERIDAAVSAAQRASKIALQKADIAISRTATARGKGEQADIAAAHAREDSDIARVIAKQFAPDFHQPGTEIIKPRVQHGGEANRIKSNRTREPSVEHHAPYESENHQSSMPNSHFTPHITHKVQPGQNTESSEKFDRNSLINQPIEPMSTYQQQQHHPSHQNTNLSHSESFNSSASRAYSTQNLNEMHIVSQEPKYFMRNNVQGTHNPPHAFSSIGMSNGHNIQGARNPPTTLDLGPSSFRSATNPHSHLNYEPSGEMEQSRGRETMRRSAQTVQRPNNPNPSSYNYQQPIADHFDHYKRPPSRDREASRDRYSRARSTTRAPTPEVGGGLTPSSRAPSRGRTPFENQQGISPGMSMNPLRTSHLNLGESLLHGQGGEAHGSRVFSEVGSAHSGAMGPFDEVVLKQKGLGQEIAPSLYTPKRTESLFINPSLPNSSPSPLLNPTPGRSPMSVGGSGGVPIKRKKSLPDAVSLPKATPGMTREEISALGSARRQAIHKMQDDAERYRANPFLYLLNPNVKAETNGASLNYKPLTCSHVPTTPHVTVTYHHTI